MSKGIYVRPANLSHEKHGRVLIKMPGHPKGKAYHGFIYRSIFIAETALGKLLPRGSIVHHIDGDTRNDKNINLVICQGQGYHALIHARTRIFLAGGKPSLQKICIKCRAIKNRSAFYLDRRSQDLLTSTCKSCVHVRNVADIRKET